MTSGTLLVLRWKTPTSMCDPVHSTTMAKRSFGIQEVVGRVKARLRILRGVLKKLQCLDPPFVES